METVKRSCLRWLLFYAVVAALLATMVYIRFPNPGVAIGIGVVAGFFLFMSVGYVVAIGARSAEKKLIRRGIHGERPADGEKIAVIGKISSSFESLEAPISKRRCVAYEYKAYTGDNEAAATYQGFHLVPLTIEGPRGSIRLLAAPELAFPEEKFTRMEHYQNLRDYIARTTFIKRTGIDIKGSLEHLKTVLADDDGRIHYDVHQEMTLNPQYTEDVTQMRITERILESGESICAIGRYSAARNALVPDPTAMMHPVKILKGEPHEVAGKVKGSSCFEGVLSCGCLLPLILGALIGLAVIPLDAIEQRFPKKDPSWQEVAVERWVKREVTPRLPAGMKSQGEYSILLDRGAARGKLTTGDTTIRLERASAKRNGDAIELTLTPAGEATAGVVAVIGSDKRVASLRILNGPPLQAADAELETFGVSPEGVSGRLIYLSPEHKLRAAFSAALEAE